MSPPDDKPLTVSAEEINCLIHAYLEDSGFMHTAYTIRNEAQLDNNPYFERHIPRGELIDLLTKSLMYMEIEEHWDGSALKLDCKSGFSLLEPHQCQSDSPREPAQNGEQISGQEVSSQNQVDEDHEMELESTIKRKADVTLETNGRVEKRPRFESEPPPATVADEAQPTDQIPDVKPEETATEATSKAPKFNRNAGPADESTPPDAIQLLQGHECEVFVCAWNPTKIGLLATGSKDAVVNIWKIPGPPPDGSGVSPHCSEAPLKLAHFAKPESADLTSLDWNPDGTLLAIGSYDAILRVCDTNGRLYMTSELHEGPIFATRFSPDGQWLLTASLDGTACLWNVRTKILRHRYRCHLDCCLDVDWINANTFASCGADKLIHILKLGEDKPIWSFTGHTNEINQIKCNPRRTRIASCSDDKTARVWNLDSALAHRDPNRPMLPADNNCVTLKGHRGNVSSVEWCPQVSNTNELLASSGFDGSARLWDSVTGDCLKVFQDHKRPVYALSFSPEGKWLATGSGDGWLHIYDVQTAQRKWSWYAGVDKPGVYEIDWQRTGNVNRIAIALESRNVGVIDVTRIQVLQDN
ncbi:WD40 repeat-like protein [Gloeophyllum trabeum ATCC 11539]|uniref:WD40 repeat-like protein n=1 Tax=Gloeophyllum trabeum (strain ATCC 11539 / FP-39264 / Madison 617) TaxID=670483 RepID=S7QLN8_GLOTA|nr:WD40 repeat-like protein [Gloeophyllum trabeum ATCC 11539]EPQ60333.1 WD40 repeat-like protein [Gloeophyllum trabeum ATCC 11539]